MASSSAAPQELEIARNLQDIKDRVKLASTQANRPQDSCLVAVSKTKPVDLLLEAFNAGQRHFGENYVQEFIEKAPELPSDIRWHFIGHLQSNKVKHVCRIPNLDAVETVDTVKLANALNKAAASHRPASEPKLRVFVQVNTSGEESKSGVKLEECTPVVKHILDDCNDLEFGGLMTIGAPGDASQFDVLSDCRDSVCKALDLPKDDVQLSMGMSGDFETAIAHGSDVVRVGSSIFGARDYGAKQ